MAVQTAVEQEKTGVTLEMWERFMQTGDTSLRNDIVLHYSNLVKVIALQMRGIYKNYAQLDDVVNQGIIALIDAVEKYDPGRNIKFETFASIKVRGSIIDFIRAQDWIPRKLRKMSKDLDAATDTLYSQMGRQPTNHELAHHMGITVEQIDRILEQTYNFNLLSYEDVVWQRMSSVGGDRLEDSTSAESPEGNLMEEELRQQLGEAVDSLNDRERTVISLYYYERLKLKEIAEVLGVSESRVCQIHSAAINKMRKRMRDYITE
ncbi:FliA/WhiG family RNA polymerase sigma factor [Oscillospiraceae bacterium MB08-C2-2]|nr:FliA/WhiG family RNA polymerase sigma factor [Oscillospiraceae bacterium MB08-C2-2]